MKQIITIFTLSVTILTGCATTEQKRPLSNIIGSTKNAVDELAIPFNHQKSDTKPTVLVATFVNNDNFNETSSLGRVLSEHIASRLAQTGFKVKEIRLREDMIYKGSKGEFALTRELRDKVKTYGADLVLVGVYAEAVNNVFVSTKMIQLSDNTLISATNFTLSKDEDISALLHGVKTKDLYYEEDEDSSNKSLFEVVKEYDQKVNESRKK